MSRVQTKMMNPVAMKQMMTGPVTADSTWPNTGLLLNHDSLTKNVVTVSHNWLWLCYCCFENILKCFENVLKGFENIAVDVFRIKNLFIFLVQIICTPCSNKNVHLTFWITQVKNQVIWMIFGTWNPEEISCKWHLVCPPHLKMLKCYHCTSMYFLKGRSYASDQISIASLKNLMYLKYPVVIPKDN